MITYIITFFMGGIICYILRKLIAKVFYWCGVAIAVILSWRIIERVYPQITMEYARPILVGAISALVVCILCSAYIRHMLILFYLQRTIQRDKDAAKAGRLW